MISKDATASVFQHLVKILGARDEKSYQFCNLNSSDIWYDTYTLVINDWIDKNKNLINKNKLDNFNEIFNRSNIKQTMMTQNYGAGYKKCWKEFKNLNDNYKLILNIN